MLSLRFPSIALWAASGDVNAGKEGLGDGWVLFALLIEQLCFSPYGLCPQNVLVPELPHVSHGKPLTTPCLLSFGDAPVRACGKTVLFALRPAWQMDRG